MFRLFAALLMALSLSAAPASAQVSSSDQPSIVIMAYGSAEAPAEFVDLTFKVRGEGKTQVEALKAMTALRARIEASLAGLTGASQVALTAADLVFYDVRPDTCSGERGYGAPPQMSTGSCPVVGFIVELAMQARLSPPSRLGDAASLLAQLGADSIDPGDGGVADVEALQARASKDALDKARIEAERLATASGGRLGRILRIQDPSAGAEGSISFADAVAAPAVLARPAAQAAPLVPIDLKVGPVIASARYVVVYELLK